eukprot:9870-Heterococcus_DN1.PRE.2
MAITATHRSRKIHTNGYICERYARSETRKFSNIDIADESERHSEAAPCVSVLSKSINLAATTLSKPRSTESRLSTTQLSNLKHYHGGRSKAELRACCA